MQQGQVFQLKRTGREGEPQWAYRYRTGGRNSQRVQRGGFASERDATDALERALDCVRREQRIPRSLTFVELVEVYLVQHDVQPVTIESSVGCSAKQSQCSATAASASSPHKRSPSGG